MPTIEILTLEEAIREVEDKIYVAKTCLPQWEKELEGLKQEHESRNWMKTDHSKVFDGLELSANHDTWERTREKYKRDKGIGAFYYEDKGNMSDDGLTVQDAKDVIKYLQQKIDYLEAE